MAPTTSRDHTSGEDGFATLCLGTRLLDNVVQKLYRKSYHSPKPLYLGAVFGVYLKSRDY
jgi:hypothetical protein